MSCARTKRDEEMKPLAWLACVIGLLLASGLIIVEGPLRGDHLLLIALAFLCGTGAALGIVYTVLAGALIRRPWQKRHQRHGANGLV